MGIYLNSIAPYDRYKTVTEGRYFVDKSRLLEELIPALRQEQRFFCITRPRRFGKTVMANMIGAFFGRANNSSDIFEKLKISKSDHFQKHLNAHDLIYIDFSETPEKCESYGAYITRITKQLKEDLYSAYPDLSLDTGKAVWDILTLIFERTGDKFIFVFDEWDALFHMSFTTEADKIEYLHFLKVLLKGRSYVELAYITGILPISKYSDGSELNAFLEYNMATKIRFGEYFGFTASEVDQLYAQYREVTDDPQFSRDDLREWYDGYCTAAGDRLYNPQSVVCALTDNQLSNYWTSSGTYDSVFGYLKNHEEEVREDLVLLFSGEGVPSDIQEYAASAPGLATKSEIYSAMVVYGLLTYENGEVYIPNKELMSSYAAMMKKEESLGYVYRLACISEKMLRATLEGDTETMTEILQYAHNTESPIFTYNHETELSAVINLVYLSARDQYRVEREDKAGRGYEDFIFYPYLQGRDGIILELKVDGTPQAAIDQIKRKEYMLRFQGKLAEKRIHTGRILAVGIGYDKKSKVHSCAVEVLRA